MTETTFRELLTDALLNHDEEPVEVTSFQEDGVLTMNEGVTVRMDDGTEFQVTIVRSA